ncbi:MAG: toprim domain-containing protein [Gemmatimonadaceae bacterium]
MSTGDETRQQLYVALTRGRDANHLYLVTAMDGDEHSVITPAATHPRTAVNVLEQVLARDEAQVSATTARQQLTDPHTILATADARYRDSLGHAAAHIQGPGWVEALEAAVNQVVPGITDSPAWPTLRGNLALLAADGHDLVASFTTALRSREIDTAADVAAVLDLRLDPTHTRSHTPGPLPWLPGIPKRLADDPYWGSYLTARAAQVTATVGGVREAAEAYTVTTATAWARLLLSDEHRQLRGDIAVFRAAHAIAEDDTRPTGKTQVAAADRRAQKDLDTRISEAIDISYRTAWTPLAVQVGLSPRKDPHWPALVEQLAALSRAGADAPALLRAAAAEGPLPDEYQAAAVWWRIARHTSPAVLTPDADAAPADPLRPAWLDQLTANLRPAAAAQLVEDPRWAAVAAAVDRAIDHGIPVTDVLRRPVGPDGNPVPEHALADALIYRASTLTDPAPPDPYQPTDLEPGYEPDEPDLAPPEDLHMLTYTGRDDIPLNLTEDGYRDGPDFDHYLRTGDPQPPFPDETIPTHEAALTPTDLDTELFNAAQHRQWMDPWESTDEQQRRLEARAYDDEFSPVTPERIADLNAQAAGYYQQTFRGSWAQTYLTDRLGTDLTGDPHIQPGYAPAGFTTLVTHLRRHGATDDELLAAGLAKTASTGKTIDPFRDRPVLPIHHHGAVAGFVGRRHPDTDYLEPGTDAAAKAGPKYLNTGDTVLYAKGDQLYGIAEYAGRFAAGATPVLVEGPIDVLAVSLASHGHDHVGVAPLGTSLTDTQADSLIPHLTSPRGVIVATDGDLAGQLATERDYWMLTARGGDPGHVTFPTGQDPAGTLTSHGPGVLQRLLAHPRPLAEVLVDERLNHLPPARALPATLAVVAAGDAQRWTQRTTDIAGRLHLPADVALTDLISHITTWDRNRHGAVAAQLASSHDTRTRLTSVDQMRPEERWAPFARQINQGLVHGHSWTMLADTIDQADRHGIDVHTLLPALANSRPLDPNHPTDDLRYRLVANTDMPIDSPTTTSPRSSARLRPKPAPSQQPIQAPDVSP